MTDLEKCWTRSASIQLRTDRPRFGDIPDINENMNWINLVSKFDLIYNAKQQLPFSHWAGQPTTYWYQIEGHVRIQWDGKEENPNFQISAIQKAMSITVVLENWKFTVELCVESFEWMANRRNKPSDEYIVVNPSTSAHCPRPAKAPSTACNRGDIHLARESLPITSRCQDTHAERTAPISKIWFFENLLNCNLNSLLKFDGAFTTNIWCSWFLWLS